MMHSTIFKVVGAILVVLALVAFLLRGTVGTPPAAPAPQTQSH